MIGNVNDNNLQLISEAAAIMLWLLNLFAFKRQVD
jgi:hypothetical protein